MAAKSTKSAAPSVTAPAPAEKSKAQIVQDYKNANPEATPKAIAEALAKQGVEINAPHVSSILSHARAGNGGGKGSSVEKFKDQLRLAGAFAKQHGDIKKALAAIESVGGFIDACGSSENAKAALAAYKEMADSLGG
ncbi:hypothetical protein [Anatilimnocola floriformis]|uniref:hypothetical protein n=1 Tax=Anatilimnocola floriformis TaxID=2948575 RepID=UPI0020C5AA17|nr:hypothetical protein [Anatilimnocola floriformis]